ncbi:hypothetical protein POVCU1_066480 [Plasmodium ovale curtisi]|uniref:Uncharacterized protein n=1 Tax=Plasmodium ovale curtisi TaxID=864141 RepID=A0A1A8X802_PLAOA|nr:hypothetical protein POVCU1_066480 [Plasmodium ovale curtisi]
MGVKTALGQKRGCLKLSVHTLGGSRMRVWGVRKRGKNHTIGEFLANYSWLIGKEKYDKVEEILKTDKLLYITCYTCNIKYGSWT